jgi:hypothetical protein
LPRAALADQGQIRATAGVKRRQCVSLNCETL